MRPPVPPWFKMLEDNQLVEVKRFISKTGDPYSIWATESDKHLYAFAYDEHGRRVAKILCMVDLERRLLKIGDVIVDERPRVRSWFARLYQPKTKRGQGIGSHLLQYVLEIAPERELERVVLSVVDTIGDQPWLVSWYARFGFRKGKIEDELGVHAQMMVLDLSANTILGKNRE